MSLEGKTAEEIAALAEFAQNLSANPKTRLGLLHLSKIANPNAVIPEIDIPARVQVQLDEANKKMQEQTDKLASFEAERSILAKRQALLETNKLGVESSDIPAIEKLMVDKHIPDYETAAEFYAMQQRAATPTPSNPKQTVRDSTMPVMDTKPFKGNINDWARHMATKAIDELRGKATIRV